MWRRWLLVNCGTLLAVIPPPLDLHRQHHTVDMATAFVDFSDVGDAFMVADDTIMDTGAAAIANTTYITAAAIVAINTTAQHPWPPPSPTPTPL